MTARGMYANLDALDAREALNAASAIGAAFGDAKARADLVYAATGDGRLAQRIHLQGVAEANRVKRG